MKSFKLLIANRGEIALRIIRCCKKMGITSIAVYTPCDKNSLHTRMADEAVCIGPNKSQQSYLHIPALISAAKLTEANGIHPGYGFLAEHAGFAEAVQSEGLLWFGPQASIIQQMGDKISAIEAMQAHDVPTVPGSGNIDELDKESIHNVAKNIGYPLLIKAAAGGGGRGIVKVFKPEQLDTEIQQTQQLAAHTFLNKAVYLEKYLDTPRHIELQIIADQHGQAFCFGERDCSLQRRQQKIIEEAPGLQLPQPALDELKQRCLEACVALGYHGAGTLEFLYQDGQFYFIEMNTRIQVEHPVSEMVYGVDLIELQIRAHLGEKLVPPQHQKPQGHAIECRINAESALDFKPSPGTITRCHLPSGPGVRVDSHIYQGYTVPPYYDSLIGKIIVHQANREQAIQAMIQALKETHISGIETNLALHQAVMKSDWYQTLNYSIHSIDQHNPLHASRP